MAEKGNGKGSTGRTSGQKNGKSAYVAKSGRPAGKAASSKGTVARSTGSGTQKAPVKKTAPTAGRAKEAPVKSAYSESYKRTTATTRAAEPRREREYEQSKRQQPARTKYEQPQQGALGKAAGWVKDLVGISKNTRKKRKYQNFADEAMRRRNKGLAIVMCFCFVILTGFLAYYQLVDRERWQQKAVDQQLKDTVLTAKRGTIYDSNMETLVQSATAWQIWIRKYDLPAEEKDAVVQMLAKTLDLSEEYIYGRLELNYTDISLRGKANKEQKDAIQAFITDEKGKIKIPGIYWVTDTKRYYYRGTLASTVLGFTNDNNEGASGIEMKYNEELSGVPGRQIVATNAINNSAMPYDYKLMVDPQEGSSLVLTIDATVQQYLEKYLRQAIKNNKVQNRACGIIMNVNTGEVLAMATLPDYDPADYQTIADEKTAAEINELKGKEKNTAISEAQQTQWKNKCITDTYEPGSVFKPITMSAALEEGVTKLSDTFSCHGYLTVNGRKIHCASTRGHGSENLTKGMMNSCNPVFMTLVSRLGAGKFYQYFTAFGLTEITGIDLPGEASGVMHTEKVLNKESDTLAVCSFGQSFKVTPVQMVTAISAVCNGGYLIQPHVVKQILDADGNIIKRYETTVKRQVISGSTSKKVNAMLEQTVSGGTAKNGYIAGYRLGGKTGTSEKIQEQAETGIKKYIASYCAIAPSDDPEIVMLVLLDEPNTSAHTGGTIAAPVVRNVLKEVLPYLGIDTIYSSKDAELLDTLAPNVAGMSVEEAKQTISAKGLEYRVIGSGDTVTAQIPQGGRSLPKGSTVVLNTDAEDFLMTTVPNVIGMSPTKANKAITDAKLNIRFSGTGYDSKAGVAVGQSILGDTTVEQGTVVTVEFIESGIND